MKESVKKWLTEQFVGDDEIISQIYSVYCADMTSGVNELNDMILSSRLQDLPQKIHALKGLAMTAGDEESVKICLALESFAKAGDFEEVKRLFPSLKEEVFKSLKGDLK